MVRKTQEREWLERYATRRDDEVMARAAKHKHELDTSKQPGLPIPIPPVQGQLALGFWTEPQVPIATPQKVRKALTVAAKDVGYQEWSKARPEAKEAVRPKPKRKSYAEGLREVIAKQPPPGKPGSIQPPPTRTGKRLAPPGHVWWVSERWTSANQVTGPTMPEPATFQLDGLQLENANGQNRGSMGAMHAYFGREKKRKQLAIHAMLCGGTAFVGWPVRITLTRIAPNEVDEDNLRGMFKRVRDGICEALGFRDDRPRDGYLAWDYKQEKGGSRADKVRGMPAVHHVKIQIEVLA